VVKQKNEQDLGRLSEGTLGELASQHGGRIQTGPFGSQLHQSDYIDDDSGVPVVMPSDMVGGRIDPHSIARVHPTKASTLSKHFLEVGDIVLARRGDIGRCAYVAPRNAGWLCGTGSMKLSLPDGPLSSKYLFYLLQTDSVIGWLNGVSVGATLKNLSAGAVSELPLRFPALEVQHSICAILDALEELIENNQQRIRLLEETVRIMYREWFVYFQYPGHEDVALVDSAFRSRPANWSHTTLGAISELSRAAANPSEIPSLSPILSLGDLPYRSTTLHDWDLPETAGSRKTEFKSGDILFAKLDPGSHKAVWAPIDGFCSTDILAFRATQPQFASLILSVASSDHFVAVAAKTANGTTHIRVSPDVLLNYPVPLPPPAILDEFDQVVSPMVRLCSHLAVTNRCLREARNLLLPRLVSGDLDISDLDLDLEAVS
jgi:type I restriction enzyme, S subunit